MSKDPNNKPPVKLTGADSNVFNLLGLCQRAARRAGWTPEEIDQFREKVMGAHSYEAALVVMMEEFDVE